MAWFAAWCVSHRAGRRARVERTESAWRASLRVALWRHGLFAVFLLLALWLVGERGLVVSRERWLAAKVGLVLFVLVPLEAFHGYAYHFWIRAGVDARTPAGAKWIERGSAMDEMLLAISVPLFVLAFPLIAWLTYARPG